MSLAKDLRGAPLAEGLRARIAADAAAVTARGVTPTLAVVVASADPAVKKYAEAKGRTAAKVGVTVRLETVEPGAGQAAALARLADLSADPAVHGIILELPVDDALDAAGLIAAIVPHKDVDGLTAANLGLIAAGREADAIAPATPLACIALAEAWGPLRGERVCVVGRGRSVGRALIPMLINRDATVTVCHTKTPDLRAAIEPCDVVFVAAGRAGLITQAHLRHGQVVVDAGINVTETGVVGDVAPDCAEIAAAMTPVPGGVGPLTSTLIFANLMQALRLQGHLAGGG
ncbi:MAG: bifunctional 5,10-methylenetetrahydrofolate dehydrogenase/5,10-methenyltetrahydrofolate cyclohydrolase [Rhodospirillaceae bacterium]|nr:bifunctional 5,10-methylenetetrahydrofolate dehydrogenase/5,10-methenyltetrahydrofolate cyclohydrolase [Rhodospirillaceae bacterium]